MLQYNELSRSSDQMRWAAQDRAILLIKEHPFFGVGLENFQKRAAFSGAEKGPMLHNCYLLIAVEMGLIALFLFLVFLCSLFYVPKQLSLHALLFFSTLVGLLMIGFVDFYPLFLQGGMVPFFIVCSLFYSSRLCFLRELRKEAVLLRT